MYSSGMGLCSGHGNSVVIRELSLYPQSLLAKLTVVGCGDVVLLLCCETEIDDLAKIQWLTR